LATLGEILRRFRFHGVPGAPVAFGVPVDRSAELELELQPVFSLLDVDQHRATDLLKSAEVEAAHSRTIAVEQGRQLLADARVLAGAARTEVAEALLADAENERSRLIAAAQLEAARIERTATERTPILVNVVVRRVLAFGKPPP
jgi:hypothetical protein